MVFWSPGGARAKPWTRAGGQQSGAGLIGRGRKFGRNIPALKKRSRLASEQKSSLNPRFQNAFCFKYLKPRPFLAKELYIDIDKNSRGGKMLGH